MPGVLALSAVLMCTSAALGQQSGATPPGKKVLVHYMPWYETKEVSGKWGWHWTMDHFHPEKIDANGRRQVAAHYYPLIGPYDSNDPDALHCHVLLMKLTGIDGVIVDWYGVEDFWDYGMLNRNTAAMIETCKTAGLSFAICYEDKTIKNMIEHKRLPPSSDVSHGQQVMRYLDKNWFHDPWYLSFEGRPVFLVFGPQYYTDQQWLEVFSVLPRPPHLLTLDEVKVECASGGYIWPPMWAGKSGILTPKRMHEYLDEFDKRAKGWKLSMGGAFPEFRDVYRAAGQRGYPTLTDAGGNTYRDTLEKALTGPSPFVQIATWNDYGESTTIEPTKERGYRYLEMTQELIKKHLRPGLPFTARDLRLPIELYNQRKRHAGSAEVSKELDRVRELLLGGKTNEGRKLLMRKRGFERNGER